MAERTIIKKYSNRRLYDTEKNAYVTLATLAEMIREGRLIEVRDAQTQEDVTAFTLTQIVLEQAKNKSFCLPVPLLYMMIQFGETVLAEFFEKYLQPVLKNYLSYKTSVDAQFSHWLDLGAQLSKQATPSFNPFLNAFDPFNSPKREMGNDEDKKSEETSPNKKRVRRTRIPSKRDNKRSHQFTSSHGSAEAVASKRPSQKK